MHKQLIGLAVLATAAALQAAVGAESEFNPVAHEPSAARADPDLAVIVKLRAGSPAAALTKLTNGADRTAALAKRTGLSLRHKRDISDLMMATRIELDGSSPAQALERLRSDPAIEFVSIDRQRFMHATTPTDSLFGNQWYLQNTEISAVNAINAWDQERGSAGIVVAVLDTGVLYDHPDLGRGDMNGKILPGYDFVSADFRVNDGDGRDADPSDPGDWVNDADKAASTALANCDVYGSTWHGTRVAGMIGAISNNSAGITGLSWNSFILPVRVLGKCGGSDSDILAGMRWAAGLTVSGVPVNPTPARILNMSLGSTSECEQTYRNVIDELTARKVLVVISAGNEGTVVSSPANCPGVAAVAALRHAGSKVGFSNLGPEVTLGAPGGNCVNVNGGPCLFSLDTTSNTGTTVPATHTFTSQTNSNLGTSFSAPIVSGIAALMLSRNANLSTAQLLARLREGTRPYPTSVDGEPTLTACHIPDSAQDFQTAQCLCTTDTCGAGMANAALSVAAAARPIATIARISSVSPGQNVALNASASTAACGRTIASYSWVVTSPTTNAPVVTDPNMANASVVAPVNGSIVLLLTVTDDQNRSDDVEIKIETDRVLTTAPTSAGTTACAVPVVSGATPGAPVQTPPPPPPPVTATPPPTPTAPRSKGGGGGSFGLPLVLLLAVMVAARSAQQRRARFSRCI
jgi:serine protease